MPYNVPWQKCVWRKKKVKLSRVFRLSFQPWTGAEIHRLTLCPTSAATVILTTLLNHSEFHLLYFVTLGLQRHPCFSHRVHVKLNLKVS